MSVTKLHGKLYFPELTIGHFSTFINSSDANFEMRSSLNLQKAFYTLI